MAMVEGYSYEVHVNKAHSGFTAYFLFDSRPVAERDFRSHGRAVRWARRKVKRATK